MNIITSINNSYSFSTSEIKPSLFLLSETFYYLLKFLSKLELSFFLMKMEVSGLLHVEPRNFTKARHMIGQKDKA